MITVVLILGGCSCFAWAYKLIVFLTGTISVAHHNLGCKPSLK